MPAQCIHYSWVDTGVKTWKFSPGRDLNPNLSLDCPAHWPLDHHAHVHLRAADVTQLHYRAIANRPITSLQVLHKHCYIRANIKQLRIDNIAVLNLPRMDLLVLVDPTRASAEALDSAAVEAWPPTLSHRSNPHSEHPQMVPYSWTGQILQASLQRCLCSLGCWSAPYGTGQILTQPVGCSWRQRHWNWTWMG